jgi:hypothetical protein
MAASARATQPRASLEEQIRRRAYERYLQRGSEPGLELDAWLQAEGEIRRTEEAVDEPSKESFPATEPPVFQIAG